MNFNKKQNSRSLLLKNLLLKAGAFLVFAIFIILIIANIKIYQRRKSLQAEVLKYEQQIQQLKDRNKAIEEQLENSDNPDYIEKIAREEQDMQKPGESVVAFITPDQQNQTPKQENSYVENKWLSWTASFWNYILNIFK